MTTFSERDITNEMSLVFRGETDPARAGGLPAPNSTYNQVSEIISTALTLYPSSIFYLAKLVSNRLSRQVQQEIQLLEGMLVAIQYVGRSEKLPTESVKLSNANTALLALDAAQSVKNRPELSVFTKNMLGFASELKVSLIDNNGNLVMSGEEAKSRLRSDLRELKIVHARVLAYTQNIIDLLSNYNELDVPSMVAKTAFVNVRTANEEIIGLLQNGTDAEKEEKRKSMLLRSLVGTSAVEQISESEVPLLVKTDSSDGYRMQMTGEGTPAEMTTEHGPWPFPLTDLELKVDGGVTQIVPLSNAGGVELVGVNHALFNLDDNRSEIYVLLDPNSYEYRTSTTFYADNNVNTLIIFKSSFSFIGFKHLGAPVALSEGFVDVNTTALITSYDNLFLGTIEDLTHLASYSSISWSSEIGTVSALTRTFDSAAVTFTNEDLGRYLKTSTGQRVEITRVIGPTSVEVDARGMSSAMLGTGAGELRGADGPTNQLSKYWSVSNYYLELVISPGLTNDPNAIHLVPNVWASKSVTIGPAIKTGMTFIYTNRSAAQVSSELNGISAAYPTVPGAILNWHVEAVPYNLDYTRIALRARSKKDPYIQIVDLYELPDTSFVSNSYPTPNERGGQSTVFEKSCAAVLGFSSGVSDELDVLKPSELIDYINTYIVGATASIVVDEVVSGVGSTTFNEAKLYDSTADFIIDGIDEWYRIDIEGVMVSGVYYVDSVQDANTLVLKTAGFGAKEEVSYRIFAEKVKITSQSVDKTTSLEIVSSPSSLGLSGTAIGELDQVEAVNSRGELLEFSDVEVGDPMTLGSVETEITSVSDDLLSVTIADVQLSTLVNQSFEIRRKDYVSYNELIANLETLITSQEYLGSDNFDENLDNLDTALSPVLVAGSGLATPRARATALLQHLLATMTASAVRTDEHGYSPAKSPNYEDVLVAFDVSRSDVMLRVIDGLQDRRYDRAIDKLLEGDLKAFFNLTHEKASYSGTILEASKNVYADLPDQGQLPEAIGALSNVATDEVDNYDSEGVLEDDEGFDDEDLEVYLDD